MITNTMHYFDTRPQLFRILFGVLAAYILTLAGINLYEFGKSPSDQNYFQDPPSSTCFIVNVLAERYDEARGYIPDSIRVGDLPTSVNGKTFESSQQAWEYLKSLRDTSLVTIRLLRPTEKQFHLYRLRKSSISVDLVRELQPTAWVTTVIEGGASDRAGMKVGDLITLINGQTFKNVGEADKILRSAQIGKTIDYEVLRGNQLLTLHVTLASFGFPISLLIFSLCGLVYVAAGIFLAEARPQFAAARLPGMFFVLMGFIMLVSPLFRGMDNTALISLRNLTLRVSFLFGPAVFLHSLHYFPKTRPELLRRKWIRTTGYVFALIGLCVFVFLPSQGDVVVALAIVAYAIFIPMPFRKEAASDFKQMNRVVRWTGAIVGGISIAFAVFVPKTDTGLWMIGYFGIVLLFIPASYFYTINRYRLMDLSFRIRRNVQYSFVSVMYTVLSVVVFMALVSWLVQETPKLPYIRVTSQSIEVVDTPTSLREQSIIEKGFLVAIVIGATVTLSRLYRSGEGLIAAKFHRARYDYRRAASELAEVMSTTLDMTHLARGIVEKLSRLMQLKRVGLLFFRDQSVCCCHEAHGFDGSTWSEFCMTIDDHLVQGLKGFSREVGVEYLPTGLKERFRQQQFHIVIPIRSKEKLVGAMLIGEKMSEAPFQREDLEFLSAVAMQASVAIENAFLYEELAEQERMKHELAIARKIQLESLPQSTPDIQGLQIAGISIPALEVGGDYFDYLNGDPSKLTVIVGDVSGKGTSAALYMSKVQGILRSLHAFGLSPRELFIRANHLLCRDLEKKSFITAIGAEFETNTRNLILARAGHLPLFHYKAGTENVEKITPKGLGLGLSPEDLFARELEERRIDYTAGDVFIFVTDGITEGQKQSGDEFGEERLLKVLAEASCFSAETIRDRVIAEVKKFAGDASQHDDQTVVVVKAV